MFLCTNEDEAEKIIREETSPFTIGTDNIKCLGITRAKQVIDLINKNFRSLKKKFKI